MKFYRCKICGNLVQLINDGGGELVCCGASMEELEPKTVDEGREKHIPVIERKDDVINVKVGSVPHPMTEAHYIEWIVIVYNNKVMRVNLHPNSDPSAKIKIEERFDEIEVYEYCNIHGLWKSTYK